MVNFLYFSMTSFFQAFFSLVCIIPCTLLIVSPHQPFGWFNLYTACLWISSLIVWKFLCFIKRWKRNISFVTFFVLDSSQPLGCVSVVFVFVAWCPDFVSFLSDQHEICTDHYNVSVTFRSRGSGTIVYRKWCFDLHVECCGSCMVSTTGVGAGKILGVGRIFARIFQTCPKSFGRLGLKNFPLKYHEDLYWDGLQTSSSCVCLQTLSAILWNQTRLGAIFARIFKDLAQNFNKSKLLGVRLHLASYTTG